jgi:hypothetical protein
MKFVHQLLLFVATLSFTQHSKHVDGRLINFGIADKVRNVINKVLHVNTQWPTESSQHNATTYFPMAQTSQYVEPNYDPIFSQGIQQSGEVSTLPQDSVNVTVQDEIDPRFLVDAPNINGKCEDGYRPVNGRCRKAYGRRRRRR